MDETELRNLIETDPSDPRFAELANLLRVDGRREEARSICYKGLSLNPSAHRGRLALAWAYYDDGYTPFALREVEMLRQVLPESRSLGRLWEVLSGNDSSGVKSSDVTEAPDNKESVLKVMPVNQVTSIEQTPETTILEDVVSPKPQHSSPNVGQVLTEAEIDLDDLL